MRTSSSAIHSVSAPAPFVRGSSLCLAVIVAVLVGCSTDSPTGVVEPRVKALKPRAEHLVCVPQGAEIPGVPQDTVTMPPSGECAPGFDSIIWW